MQKLIANKPWAVKSLVASYTHGGCVSGGIVPEHVIAPRNIYRIISCIIGRLKAGKTTLLSGCLISETNLSASGSSHVERKNGQRGPCLTWLRNLAIFLLDIDWVECLTKQPPINCKGTLWASTFILDRKLPSPLGSKCWSPHTGGWRDWKPNKSGLHLEARPA